MLNRIFVILAILAGLAVIGVTHFMIRPHVQAIIDEREFNLTQWRSEETQRKKFQKELRETEDKLVATEQTLKETEGKLEQETTRANTQQELAGRLQNDLNATRTKLTAAQQELGAWDALGLEVDEVMAVIQSEKRLAEMNEVLEAEKAILTRVNNRIKRQLDEILGERQMDPPLPPGTKGQVLVVDPKWKFVVLDIGEEDDVVPNGVLMVSRDGKLIAKVRITSVYTDRCIANVMPGWDFGDILEGDLVLY